MRFALVFNPFKYKVHEENIKIVQKYFGIIYFFVIFLLASIIYSYPLLQDIKNWGAMDWDQYTFWHAVPREVILRYHQFPLWNPYSNGGNVLLAHTHSPFLSPFYIFVLIFGPIVGLKFEIIIHLLIGMFGMFFLSKHMHLNRRASYLPPIVYMLSSIYTLHLTEGHIEWLAMAFAPWLFLYFLKSLSQTRCIFGGIFFLALILLAGSVNVSSIIILLFFIYSILKVFQQKGRRTVPLERMAIIFTGAFLLCSVRLIPMLEFLKENPRKIESNEATEVSLLPSILLSRDQRFLYQHTKWANPEQKLKIRGREFEYGWHEYGAYIGLAPLFLAVIGFFFYFKNHWPLLLTAILSLWVSLGRGAFYDLWDLLHRFPIYDSLHVPSRFILGFIFCASLFSGLGLSKLEDMSNNKCCKFLIGIIVGFVLFDLFLVNYPLLSGIFTIRPPEIKKYSEFKQRFWDFNLFPGKSRSSMYPALLSNSGIINSYEVISIIRGNVKTVKDPGYKGEVYFFNTNNKVESILFSPNRLKIKTNVKEQDRLVVNQNFCRGWRVKVNKKRQKVNPFNGLISIELARGKHDITFYYLPMSFIIGAILSLITCLSYIVIYWRLNRYCLKKL